MMPPRPQWTAILLLSAAALLSACHTMDGPEIVTLSSADYPRTFEACLDQAREAGMPAALADRSIGIIETKPRHIGSFVEPWRLDSSGLEQTASATLQFERRRVRFEFTPTGFELPAPGGDGTLSGPRIPGSLQAEQRFDLERYQGPIELRAWVYIERGFTPGLNTDPWSLSLTTTWTDPLSTQRTEGSDDTSTRSPTQWTPIARDEAMERTLLARVMASMTEPTAAPATPTAPETGAAAMPVSATPPSMASKE